MNGDAVAATMATLNSNVRELVGEVRLLREGIHDLPDRLEALAAIVIDLMRRGEVDSQETPS